MHLISFIALAAVIPAALSHPVPSASLTTRDAGNEVIEPRSVDISNVLQGRASEPQLRVFYLWQRTLANWFSPRQPRHDLTVEAARLMDVNAGAAEYDRWMANSPAFVRQVLYKQLPSAADAENVKVIRVLWGKKKDLLMERPRHGH